METEAIRKILALRRVDVERWEYLLDVTQSQETSEINEADAELAAIEAEITGLRGEIGFLEEQIAEMGEAKVIIDTWGMDFLERLGTFVRESAKNGPLTTCIEARIGEEGESVPLLWLWATIDEKQPVARIRELAAEKARLQKIVDVALTTADSGKVLVDREKLREIEWAATDLDSGKPCCPECLELKQDGHHPDC